MLPMTHQDAALGHCVEDAKALLPLFLLHGRLRPQLLQPLLP